MADIELARAYVEIIPVTKGISKKAHEELFPSEKSADQPAERLGSRFASRLGTALKRTAIGVGVAAGGVLATSLAKGFGRLSAIENAEAKLVGLGNSADDVAAIMDNALAAVKGTAFGMDEAATTAASAVAAGIKPGKELESYLRLVGDAATIAGTDMASMGSIFNKVATSGKVQGDIFNQLGDKGIPIVTLLAEQLGVTAGEVYKMGAAGSIGTEDFLAAMSSMSGAALEGGNTTTGAFKNMGAALSRFGAQLLSGVYPLFGPFFGAITGVIDQATDAIGPVVERIAPALQSAAETALSWVETLTGSVGGIVEVFRSGDFDPSKWADGISEDSPLVTVAFTIRDAWTGVRDTLGPAATWIGDTIRGLIPHARSLLEWFAGLSTGAKAAFGGTALVGGLAAVGKLGTTLGALGGKVKGVLGPLGRLAPALRFLTGPVGLIVTGLVTLIATNDEVRDSFGGLLEAIAGVVGTTLSTLAPVLGDLAVALGPVLGVAAGVVGKALQALAPVVVVVVDAVAGLLGWLEPVLPIVIGVAGAVFGLVKVFGIVAPIVSSVVGVVGSLFSGLGAVLGAVKAVGGALLAATGPVGWIIAGVVALGVALWAFFTKTETGRQWWATIWGGIKAAVAGVADWAVGTAWPALQAAWDGIAAGAVWLWQNVFTPVWEGIKVAVAIAAAAVMTYIDLLAWYFRTVIAPVAMWLWRNVITPAWNGIQAAIGAVVSWFQNTAWPIVQRVIGWLRMSFEGWKLLAQAVWSAVRSAIHVVVSWFQNTAWPIISSILKSIESGFNRMRDTLRTVWNAIRNTIIAPVVTWFRDTVQPIFTRVTDGIKDSFNVMKDGVKKAWEQVRDTAKKPVKFVVENIVRDGIVKKYNEIAGMFGVGKIDEKKFTVGWAAGGWTGPGSKYLPAGVVHADEFVIRKESQRSLRAAAPGFLDDLNRRGARALESILGGYASGGWVKPFRGNFASNSGFGMRWGRLHGGMDFPTPVGTPMIAVSDGTIVSRTTTGPAGNKIAMSTNMPGIVAGYHHLSRFGAQVGQRVTKGQIIGWSGNTGRSTGPHLHFSIARDGSYVNPAPYLAGAGVAGTGANDGGGLWNPFEGLWDNLKDRLRKGVGDSAFADVLFNMPKKVLDSAVSWASRKLTALGDWASDKLDNATGYTRWAPVATQALRMEGQFGPKRLASLMRRMNQESSFNPRAINNWDVNARNGVPSKGLMQVIDPTFRAYARPGYDKDIWDPLSNILASIRYALARYGDLERAYDRPGGYAEGGLVTAAGGVYDNGGWLPPGGIGVNLSNRPEPVFTGAQWDIIAKGFEEKQGRGRFGDVIVQVESRPDDDPSAFGRRIGEALDLHLRTVEVS